VCSRSLLSNHRATTELSTLSLHDALPISSVDCIIVARPTQSAVLYQQMLGRGTRTYPGKTDCLVLDVVGVSTHETIGFPRICARSEEHTSELQSLTNLVCRLLLEKKKQKL